MRHGSKEKVTLYKSQKKIKKKLKKVLRFKKNNLSLHYQINNNKNHLIMKRSTYAIAFGITILFFATLAYIAIQIVKLNGSLPIDFI